MRLAVLALLAGVGLAQPAMAQEATTFRAADGTVVHAREFGRGNPRGVVLAFHMAGSNKGEYDPIAPQLARAGFEVIAVDQRSGGTMWGQPNQTAHGAGAGYLAAQPDLEAAFQFAKQSAAGRPIVVIGSSYSASLAIVLASRHPDIAAVAAFSPGEYFSGLSVRAAASGVAEPFFVTSASDPGEVAEARALLTASPAKLKQQFVPQQGVHGASTLRTDKNPAGATAAWRAFDAFLDAAIPPRAG